MKENKRNQSLAAFEQKFHTSINMIQLLKRSQTGNITRYAKFEMDDKDTWVAIKRTTDLNLPKEQICISYCELKDRSEHFWLIYEPYKSHLFKNRK